MLSYSVECNRYSHCSAIIGDKARTSRDGEVDSDEEEQAAYISSISKRDLLKVMEDGAKRILRSGVKLRFPPTEMILASDAKTGTYKKFDINQRVASILNDFQVPKRGKTKHLFAFHEANNILHLHGHLSYTATVRYKRGTIQPCAKGSNSFWETGYVGGVDGVPYYSTRVNARRAVALRILVDYYAYATEKLNRVSEIHLWPKAIMNGTIENFVVLSENCMYGTNPPWEDHLFCILIRHHTRYTLLIPRSRDYRPWKEIEFNVCNWSRKRSIQITPKVVIPY